MTRRAIERLREAATEHGWRIVDVSGAQSLLFERDGVDVYVICDAIGRPRTVRIGERWIVGQDKTAAVLAVLTGEANP